MEFTISPYNLQATIAEECTNKPTLTLANGSVYEVSQYHLHLRSEHKIDNTFYPAEFHIVHDAVAPPFNSAAVSVLIQIFRNENNPILEPYIDGWTETAKETIEVCESTTHTESSEPPTRIANPYQLLPQDSKYYFYRGSLTTPPCTEFENWHVFETPLSISVLQYQQLTSLLLGFIDPQTCESGTLSSEGGTTNRPVQKLNNRTVDYRCE